MSNKTTISKQAQQEITNLRETILALRKELEGQRYDKAVSVQKAIQRTSKENEQLKNTILNIRVELESLQYEKDESVQKTVQRSADEIFQLKTTISNLRNELESLNYKKDTLVQEEILRSVNEIKDEVRQYINNGIKEIIFLGQNVNAYHGENQKGKQVDLAYLINTISEFDKICTIDLKLEFILYMFS